MPLCVWQPRCLAGGRHRSGMIASSSLPHCSAIVAVLDPIPCCQWKPSLSHLSLRNASTGTPCCLLLMGGKSTRAVTTQMLLKCVSCSNSDPSGEITRSSHDRHCSSACPSCPSGCICCCWPRETVPKCCLGIVCCLQAFRKQAWTSRTCGLAISIVECCHAQRLSCCASSSLLRLLSPSTSNGRVQCNCTS